MGHKEASIKRQNISQLIILIVAIVILGMLIFKKPTITGRVIDGKEAIYSENLNLKINESGSYEWQVKNPGSIKSLKATGSVTSNGTAKVYIEKNDTKVLLFDSTKQLFDVDVDVLPDYKKIFQGEKILIQNVLFNLRGFGAGNVNVKYSIRDSKGNLIAAEEEEVFVETQAKFIRELVMPAEIKAGTYVAFVEASTNGTIVGTSSDTFEVKVKYEVPIYEQLRYYIMGTAAVVATLIIGILTIYGFKKLKKKKKIAELKERQPEEKIEKLEKELEALEKAYKSKFISEVSYKRSRERIKKETEKLKIKLGEMEKRLKEITIKTINEKIEEIKAKQIEEEKQRKALEEEKLRRDRKITKGEFFHKVHLYKSPEEKEPIALQKEAARQEKERTRQEEKRKRDELLQQREQQRLAEERKAQLEAKRKELEEEKQRKELEEERRKIEIKKQRTEKDEKGRQREAKLKEQELREEREKGLKLEAVKEEERKKQEELELRKKEEAKPRLKGFFSSIFKKKEKIPYMTEERLKWKEELDLKKSLKDIEDIFEQRRKKLEKIEEDIKKIEEEEKG